MHERMEWRDELLPVDVTFLFPNNQANKSIHQKLLKTHLNNRPGGVSEAYKPYHT